MATQSAASSDFIKNLGKMYGTYTGAFLVSMGLGVFAALVNLPVNEKPLAERQPALA